MTTIAHTYRKAASARLVSPPDANALNRARRAFRRNLAEPGDCAGDNKLLLGLAIAFADVGLRAGWIPETQRVGVAIAELV